jgi:hypothetical protein
VKSKNLILISCFCLAFSVCNISNVIANDTKKIGFGASYKDYGTIYVPIFISPNFFIEPELSIHNRTSEANNTKYTNKVYSIGVGIFPKTNFKYFDLYYGARIGYERRDSTNSDGNAYYIAPALGAEYFFVEKFSISGEAQLKYYNYREDSNDNISYDEKGEYIDTITQIIIRYYF